MSRFLTKTLHCNRIVSTLGMLPKCANNTFTLLRGVTLLLSSALPVLTAFAISAVAICTTAVYAQPSSAYSPQKTISAPSAATNSVAVGTINNDSTTASNSSNSTSNSNKSTNAATATQNSSITATNDLNNLAGKRPKKAPSTAASDPLSKTPTLEESRSEPAIENAAREETARINKHTAVKEKLAQQIYLPGVRKLNSNEAATLDFSRSQLIGVNELGSKTAYIAIGEYNRLELPFLVNYAHTVYDKNKIAVERSESKSANSLYITSLSQQGTTLYLETADGKAIAINLSPKKDIPAQTIVVQNTTENTAFSDKALSSDGNSQEAKWTNALTVAAAGKVPQGFSDSQFTSGMYQKNELKIRPVRVLSSANMDIFDYEIRSAKDVTTKVEEDDLDLKLAQAHTFFPSNVIEPGKTIHALVLIKRY